MKVSCFIVIWVVHHTNRNLPSSNINYTGWQASGHFFLFIYLVTLRTQNYKDKNEKRKIQWNVSQKTLINGKITIAIYTTPFVIEKRMCHTRFDDTYKLNFNMLRMYHVHCTINALNWSCVGFDSSRLQRNENTNIRTHEHQHTSNASNLKWNQNKNMNAEKCVRATGSISLVCCFTEFMWFLNRWT